MRTNGTASGTAGTRVEARHGAARAPAVSALVQGMALGIAAALLWVAWTAFGAADGEAASRLPEPLVWVYANLRGSLIPFVLVLLLFLHAVERLRRRVTGGHSLESVAQAEYWAELWTTLFFGIGVIWTAIGMRSALLAGLGDLDSSVAAEVGAFAILRRLVDGGILLALSTTIVGGIGGYLMRVHKGLRTGALLRARYAEAARASETAVLERLDRLEVHLARLARGVDDVGGDVRPIGRG